MKKKGFTLVELLATIVVLSVIALIATPIILNVIEKAKKGALVSSVNGLVESANMYYTNEIIKGDISEDVVFDFEEGIQTSSEKLSYKGKVYNGKLILTSDSDVITCIDDGKYYAYKEKDSDEVISGIGTCLYDGTTGDFTIESDVDVIIKECDEDKKELQEQITNLTTTVNNLQQTISEKEQAISDLTSIKEGLENQITTLEGEKEDLLKQIENSNLSNSELQNKIIELEGTIDTLESSIEAKNNEITVLNGEKADLQNQLTTKTNELKTLNENLGKVTATASDVLSGKTILGNDGNLITGTITSLAAKTYTPGTSNQTIASGQYLSGVQTIKGDANLVSANIKSGVTIFGVSGNANVVDTSSGDATATQILSGKKAYVDGKLVTGTIANKAGSTVTATTVTNDDIYTYAEIPEAGYYDTNSKIMIENANLSSSAVNTGLADYLISKKSIVVSSKSGDILKDATNNRYFTRTSDSPTIVAFVVYDGTYYGYAYISSSNTVISGTASSYGDIGLVGSFTTPKGNTAYLYSMGSAVTSNNFTVKSNGTTVSLNTSYFLLRNSDLSNPILGILADELLF